MLDVLVSEIRLQRAGIDAVVCELEAAGMPQHVWMQLKFEVGDDTRAGNQLLKPRNGEGRAALAYKYERACLGLAFEAAQCAKFVAGDRVRARGASLATGYV